MVGKLEDITRIRRLEFDLPHGVGTADLSRVGRTVDLHLSLDEIAELIAVQYTMKGYTDGVADVLNVGLAFWLSLDPDDINVVADNVEESDDCLVYTEIPLWWKNVVGAQEAGHWPWAYEFIHFPPGLFTAVNPVVGFFKDSDEIAAEGNVAIYYHIMKPTVNELAGIVARRR